jgi:hypothetical protein
VCKDLAGVSQRVGELFAQYSSADQLVRSSVRITRALAVVAALAIASVMPAFAQTGGASPGAPPGISGAPVAGAPAAGASVPSSIGATSTTETPYESPAGDGAAPATLSHTSSHRHAAAHHTKHTKYSSTAESDVVEPAQGHLKLIHDSYAYRRPSKSSTKIQTVQGDKFVNVIGTTRHYAQVRLKDEEIAYVPLTAIDLVKPTDKQFTLTADSAVLSAPSHSSSKVAEVHRGRDVHVVGIAMNYAKIRMKNGTEGFIPIHVLE